MKIFKGLLLSGIIILLATSLVFGYTADRWAYETRSGIPGLSHPLGNSNSNSNVNSSWNEPRSTVHKGVDQRASTGTEVYPMYDNARVIDNNLSSDGAQTIRYYDGTTSKTFYSIYFHLSAYAKNEDEKVTLTDVTAYTGETGSPGSPHLHWEVIDSVNISGTGPYSVDYGSRIGVNPMNYVTPNSADLTYNTWVALSVFKNPSVSGHRLTIEAWDSDVASLNNIAYLSEVDIFYKADGSSTYTSASMTQDTSNSKLWHYDFLPLITTVDYFVAGRRSSSEGWVTFPVRRILDSSNIDTSKSYDTKTINF